MSRLFSVNPLCLVFPYHPIQLVNLRYQPLHRPVPTPEPLDLPVQRRHVQISRVSQATPSFKQTRQSFGNPAMSNTRDPHEELRCVKELTVNARRLSKLAVGNDEPQNGRFNILWDARVVNMGRFTGQPQLHLIVSRQSACEDASSTLVEKVGLHQGLPEVGDVANFWSKEDC
jgi:hypothetical protein